MRLIFPPAWRHHDGRLPLAETTARPIRLGDLLRQADNQRTSIAESARISDDLGFHAIHFIDRRLAIPDPTGDILESWATMTAGAARIRRVRVSNPSIMGPHRRADARNPSRRGWSAGRRELGARERSDSADRL